MLLASRMMGDLVIAMMRRTAQALLTRRPYTAQDEARASQDIPPPVLPVRASIPSLRKV